MISSWPCPLRDGTVSEELIIRHGPEDAPALLIIPPLFAEHNLMRRQIVLLMQELADAGFHTILPDLPGCNESLEPLPRQTLAHWRAAMEVAIDQFGISSVLAIRSGALLAPENAAGFLYAPQSGAKLLRGMIRAQSLSSRESGTPQSSEDLLASGRTTGVCLGGWDIGSEMFRELEAAEPPSTQSYAEISQSQLDGGGLWLRAEPGEDEHQSAQLAKLIVDLTHELSGKNP